MADTKLYSDIQVYVEGALLTEENHVTVTRDANFKEVDTVARGFAGVSRGSGRTTLQIRNAVPAAGVEFDPGSYMKALQTVEITLFRAGAQLTGKFYVRTDTSEHSVNAESSLNFDAIGPFVDWQ